MLQLNLYRFSNDALGNVGFLVLDGRVLCHTLELPWKGNVINVSAIPPGSYTVQKHISPKFGDCFFLPSVPGRSEILIHAGNSIKDTKGCILVGETSDLFKGTVGNSRQTMVDLYRRLPSNFNLVII